MCLFHLLTLGSYIYMQSAADTQLYSRTNRHCSCKWMQFRKMASIFIAENSNPSQEIQYKGLYPCERADWINLSLRGNALHGLIELLPLLWKQPRNVSGCAVPHNVIAAKALHRGQGQCCHVHAPRYFCTCFAHLKFLLRLVSGGSHLTHTQQCLLEIRLSQMVAGSNDLHPSRRPTVHRPSVLYLRQTTWFAACIIIHKRCSGSL